MHRLFKDTKISKKHDSYIQWKLQFLVHVYWPLLLVTSTFMNFSGITFFKITCIIFMHQLSILETQVFQETHMSPSQAGQYKCECQPAGQPARQPVRQPAIRPDNRQSRHGQATGMGSLWSSLLTCVLQ